MIIKTHPLPVKRQAELLEISRSNVYYLPTLTSEKDLALMRAIDELHLEYPFLGARQLSRIFGARRTSAGRASAHWHAHGEDGHYGVVS